MEEVRGGCSSQASYGPVSPATTMSLLSLVHSQLSPTRRQPPPPPSQAPAASPQGESVARCGVCSEVQSITGNRVSCSVLLGAHDKGANLANKVTSLCSSIRHIETHAWGKHTSPHPLHQESYNSLQICNFIVFSSFTGEERETVHGENKDSKP